MSAGVPLFMCRARSAGKVPGIAFKFFRIEEKVCIGAKKFRCGDCIRESMPI
jgi:hypothetical protein